MTFNTALYTDLYQLAMGQAYYLKGKHQVEASFDYFYRKAPFDGGYVLFCGLEDALEWLEQVSFSEEDLDYLLQEGFNPGFVDYLRNFRFTGTVQSVAEGEVVFPFAPIMTVTGPVVECQIVETFLLNTLNFQSLIATKASRIRYISGKDRTLAEFGLRRAQGYAGLQASRAAFIGGFDATSNVLAGKTFGIPVTGTMAHAYVQSYDDELTAFRDFAETHPDNCVLLVDTYNTLESGIPNAITIAHELEQKGKRLIGIRLDSGDLAYLSKMARKMLDDAGLSYVKIAASNQLDEHVIRSLKEQQTAIDIYGVGTNLVVGHENAALDGVYKLCNFEGEPRIKISENLKKMNFPGEKQVYRYYNGKQEYMADAITFASLEAPEGMAHPFEPHKRMPLDPARAKPLLHPVMKDGKRLTGARGVREIAAAATENLKHLPVEHKRFDFPHVYKVGLSRQIEELRNNLKAEKLKMIK
ncbi:nicotinate phosphoribosyltransferase [Sinomicrobium weinanense]|uniref:Nicotinate phosphoribosyltransferase n=1 Tax=Sinomicrobium weinanense TaxID=2842200 RepID=A0A926Q067_9FLAO|nr:nicotinate phosphoribosyltransferase [Sinomicrobium weinanense]MBC9794588.1 nicotinate phosphoribosyltransferase [Sinomicrobium weinanense]MBU3124073.1 nicotinate phosphoribosyltransferase [Sinomicrobium weinanense]